MSNPRFDEFRGRFTRQGGDAAAVAKLFVEAMTVLEQDADLGLQMMALLTSKRDLDETPGTLSGYSFRRTNQAPGRLRAAPNIARSYAGGTWQQDYRDFDAGALRIELDTSYSPGRQGVDYPSPGQAKFFVRCGGADRPRPLTLARNSAGVWKVTEYSSLTLGVRPGAAAAGDF